MLGNEENKYDEWKATLIEYVMTGDTNLASLLKIAEAETKPISVTDPNFWREKSKMNHLYVHHLNVSPSKNL